MSRRRPAGTRSPSQRERDSIVEVTPPRLVAFAINRVVVSTRRAASPSATSNEMSAAEARIADDLDGGWSRRRSAISRAVSVWRATRTSSVCSPRRSSQAASGAATMPVRVRNSRSRVGVCRVAAHERADQGVVVPGQALRRGVERDVAAALEWAQMHGRSRRRVADDGRRVCGRSLEVRHRQERVRRRLDPDESRPPEAGPVWSNSTCRRPQRSSSPRSTPVP